MSNYPSGYNEPPSEEDYYQTAINKLEAENAALIAERDQLRSSEAFLKDSIDTSINDTKYYEAKYLDAKKDYEECSQAVFFLGKERDALLLDKNDLIEQREKAYKLNRELQARIDGGIRVRANKLESGFIGIRFFGKASDDNATIILDQGVSI